MLRTSTTLAALFLLLACGDSSGAGDDQPAFCADEYAGFVSALLEPCLQDINCIEGKCRNNVCSETCAEDNDCLGDAVCVDGVCKYTCESGSAVECTGYDLNASSPNMACDSSGTCISTFICEP
jgi:hypothetical protein